MTLLAFAIIGGWLSWWATGQARGYAIRRAMFDVPNDRSSHTVSTPRGGGIAIAVTTLIGTSIAGMRGLISLQVAVAIVGGGALVAAIGWLDDRREVPPPVRIVVHLLAAIWSVAWLGGMPSIELGVTRLDMGLFGTVIAVAGIVWAINLYNFMDGIDGIAGSEAVMVGLIAGGLLWLRDARGLATISVMVAASSAGFLVWNWAPAKIFMGDTGSGLLGFLFAVLALASENAGAAPLLSWVTLMGVFVFDATATLLRRAARGDRVHTAHRSHAYQRVVQSGVTHARVTQAVAALTAVLGVLCLIATSRPSLLLPVVAVAFGLLFALYLRIESLRPMDGPTA